MQLYLIRHAQSENNALYERTGSNLDRSMDPELTGLGIRQAQILAEFLTLGDPNQDGSPDPHNRQGFNLSHLYCSLMLRAVATGSIIARKLAIPLCGWVDWHEGGGIYLEDPLDANPIGYPGHNRDDLLERFPDLIVPTEIGQAGWWNRPFEERPQRWERASRVLAELQARHGGSQDRVAVVMHGGFYNYIMKTLLAIDRDLPVWFALSNAAITRIDFTDEMRLVYQNRLDFMPDELVSAG